MSLLPRTLLWRTVLLIALLLLVSQVSWVILYRIYQTGPRVQQIAGQIAGFASLVSATLESVPDNQRERFLRHLAHREGIRIMPMRRELVPIREPQTPALAAINQYLREELGKDTTLVVQRVGKGAVWISAQFADQDYWIVLPRNRIELPFPWQWVGWGIMGLLLSMLGAYLIVSRINQPLRQLAVAATCIGKGETPELSETRGPQEIRALSRAFNQMAQDLQRLDADRTLLLAGVSHDLRSPLARLRLAAEMLDENRDATLKQGMVQDVEDMDNIISQFLDFARAHASEPSKDGDLNRLVGEVAERFARLGKPIKTDLGILPSVSIKPMAMQRLITNLIDNALRYGGHQVEVRTHYENRMITMSILDRGPGIPVPERARLLQPFTRLDPSRGGRSGSGLGLAIVERIAKMHNGRFRLLSRQGGGLEARLELPDQSGVRGDLLRAS